MLITRENYNYDNDDNGNNNNSNNKIIILILFVKYFKKTANYYVSTKYQLKPFLWL